MKTNIETTEALPWEVPDFLEVERNRGAWTCVEYSKSYGGGCSILVRAYRCPFCKNERPKVKGRKNYCDNCGADLREDGGTKQ